MMPKRKDQVDKVKEINCPNCNTDINLEELGLIMFKSCTVFSCPVCKKTIAIQPKGNEFVVRTHEE